MRAAAVILLIAAPAWAQFKSTAPLVLAPITVTDAKGNYIDGLSAEDLVLYDDNEPQPIQMDWTAFPIDLIVAVETGENSGAVLDKLGGSGILLSQLLAADAGQTAVLSFSGEVTLRQDFTARPKTAEDEKPIDERIKVRKCRLCAGPDDTPVPADLGPGGLEYAIAELARLRRPDLSTLFTNASGGRTLGFLKKDALERTIQLVGEEVHRQYVLSFHPRHPQPGAFHTIRVVVKDRPDLIARTRKGYWAVE